MNAKLTLFIPLGVLLILSCNSTKQTDTYSGTERKWWKESVVYQIYPRSFKDSNGDGVGDLKGIISKLDYIKSLGVDVIWLNPIFSSPNDDNGYDISDYRGIMEEFGTMSDFDSLLIGMHRRGLKLVLDLVVNHSSDEHLWFKKSRSSRTNKYRDYYHWWPAERGKPTHRWSYFDENADAWKYDSVTNSYYLHYFSIKQPDLNWENPTLRNEIYDMMRFWFNKGIDGFRMDVIPYISKDTTFPPIPPEYHGDYATYYAHGPHLHDYLKEMNKEVLSKYDIMTVAEGAGANANSAHDIVDADRNELNMLYHFETTALGTIPNKFKTPDSKGYRLIDFKNIFSKWDSTFSQKGWGTIYLGNHDQPRMVSRWGNDSTQFRELSSKMLFTFLLTMRATPYCYFGDEIGMTNIRFNKIEDYNDIETKNMYKLCKKNGGDLKEFIDNQKILARDNGRTPFQWDSTKNAGFTTGIPWLKINENFKTMNEAVAEIDSNSILNYFKRLIKLRKSDLTLVYGKYTLIDKLNPNVYAYLRTSDESIYLVLLNFKAQSATVNLSAVNITNATFICGNYSTKNFSTSVLRPYEAAVYKLKK